MSTLTHFDASGQAHMVDVGDKAETKRIAIATGYIDMQTETLQHIQQGDNKKGDVLGIARIAGIQGAKRTSDLIPLCHPIALAKVSITFEIDPHHPRIYCITTAECYGKTGVEMEALTATSTSLLTIYDMCKAIDRGMIIGEIKLLEKAGGQSGHWRAENAGA